jgi:hydroxyacylglutathione hydrolase
MGREGFADCGEKTMAIEIRTVESMPFAENTYVVWQPGRREAIVFDPGMEPDLIFEVLQQLGLAVAAIAGNAALKHAFPDADLIIGHGDAVMLVDANANLSAPFGLPLTSPPADETVREGDIVEFAGIRLEVLEIPGHSPGHVVYVHRDQPICVFGGDVLFRGSIGRSDFPGGSHQTLIDGIHAKLLTLPPDTVVYPGHGPTTTVGHEKRTNPFLSE